ncbi:MAG: IS1634 family transposase [Betaproteobacteria bacterium]|nr:IS1634 family transposase [Betaproteobacteria bacterium]
MDQPQVLPNPRFALRSERLGPLPLINHFLQRIGLAALLEQFVPTTDRRCTFSHAAALGVLLRSIIVEREPIYRQGETAVGFASGLFGLSAAELEHLGDDRLGRALDHLFDADRAALLTAVVVAVGQKFGVTFDQLHNDSTSVAFCGQYRAAAGRALRGRTAPAITYGFSKDHRPDLKQLLFILTIDADGGVPVQFRVADGNTNDSITHIETWNTLRALAGRADFLYVADSKLCSRDNMEHIARCGGRFVTVLPRSRLEDAEFRKWIQTNTPPWELVWDRPNPRASDGPRDCWSVYRAELPSAEAWPVTWVFSTLLKLRQESRRRRNIAAASEALDALHARLLKARARLRGAAQIDLQVAEILDRYHVGRYLKVQRTVREEHAFKQTRRGRPGPATAYRKITHRRYDIEWTLDTAAVDYDKMSDGMYPLLTNDRNLSPAAVLTAHKGQPRIEKRFEQLKTVHEIAPVFLKNEGRIEALFTLYFLALLVQALIERELRQAMQREHLETLPIYPEQRACRRPTTEQILRLFSLAERHTLLEQDRAVQCFQPELTELQCQVLNLLSVPQSAFRPKN